MNLVTLYSNLFSKVPHTMCATLATYLDFAGLTSLTTGSGFSMRLLRVGHDI